MIDIPMNTKPPRRLAEAGAETNTKIQKPRMLREIPQSTGRKTQPAPPHPPVNRAPQASPHPPVNRAPQAPPADSGRREAGSGNEKRAEGFSDAEESESGEDRCVYGLEGEKSHVRPGCLGIFAESGQ